ncbi:M48 family metallopeptidase [Romboutsia sp.]|uniref:M48 family metallopeptidase n=1 Tax=Romboutsia sp. TaxID=1965302 RepID=UPI003F2B0AA0
MNKEKNTIVVNYKNNKIKAKLIYRKRKNITIQIKPKENVTIITPSQVPITKLEEILVEKGDWILKKIEEYKDVEYIDEERELKTGTKLFYLGKEYVLKVIKNTSIATKRPEIYIIDNNIIFNGSSDENEYIKLHLKQWYKKESEKIIIERLIKCRENSQTMMKLIPSTLKVKEQKRRWGTCTSKRAIYINSKIAMARPESIDYILIHEFSHLVHLNHSKDFYNLVKSMMPDYKLEEEWLKKYSYMLTL